MVRLGLSNDPVGFGGRFAALRRLRSRLMAMQRLHHRDPRHHRVAAMLGDEQQHLGGELPWRGLLFGLRQARDVGRGIAQRDERLAVLHRDRIEKLLIPRHDLPRPYVTSFVNANLGLLQMMNRGSSSSSR
jgi:hypothetical protein